MLLAVVLTGALAGDGHDALVVQPADSPTPQVTVTDATQTAAPTAEPSRNSVPAGSSQPTTAPPVSAPLPSRPTSAPAEATPPPPYEYRTPRSTVKITMPTEAPAGPVGFTVDTSNSKGNISQLQLDYSDGTQDHIDGHPPCSPNPPASQQHFALSHTWSSSGPQTVTVTLIVALRCVAPNHWEESNNASTSASITIESATAPPTPSVSPTTTGTPSP